MLIAESTFTGYRIITRRCNITGGCDLLQPLDSQYHEFIYGHGGYVYSDRHPDAIQIVGSRCDSAVAQHFGGWGAYVRCATLLPGGEQTSAQFIMMGNQFLDLDRSFLQDIVGGGGVSSIRDGLGWYVGGYNYQNNGWNTNPAYRDANGQPDASLVPDDPNWVHKTSDITGKSEWHPSTQLVFFDNIRVNQKRKNTPAAYSLPASGESPVASEGVFTTSWYYFANKDWYGTGYPYTTRKILWDNDGSEGRNVRGPSGFMDWSNISHPLANALDFTPLYPVIRPPTDI